VQERYVHLHEHLHGHLHGHLHELRRKTHRL